MHRTTTLRTYARRLHNVKTSQATENQGRICVQTFRPNNSRHKFKALYILKSNFSGSHDIHMLPASSLDGNPRPWSDVKAEQS